MAKGKSGGGKERITPPSKQELKVASEALRKGSPLGGRVMAEKAVAKRQGKRR